MNVNSYVRHFNLVEIVASLVIIAFGVTAAMAILQPSVRASRDAVGDNYCADVANQILSYMEGKARQNWTTVVGISTGLTSTCPPSNTPTSIADSNVDDPTTWAGQITDTNIYTTGGSLSTLNTTVTNGIPDKGVFGIKLGQDFSAHVRVWKKQVADFNYGTSTSILPPDKAVRFCVEISYPANKPYASRERKNFALEVFNQ